MTGCYHNRMNLDRPAILLTLPDLYQPLFAPCSERLQSAMPDSRTSSLHSASKAAQEAAHLHLDGDAASHRHPDPALDLDRNGATPAASAPRSTNIRHVPALDHSSSSSSCSHLQQEQHESQSQSQPIVTRTRFGHLRSETLRYLSQTIHHDDATIPLAWHCFLTGAIDAIVYARTGIWVAFQTGNMVQFSQNMCVEANLLIAPTQKLTTIRSADLSTSCHKPPRCANRYRRWNALFLSVRSSLPDSSPLA